MQDIRASLDRVRERIARAALRGGRRPEQVLLIGVSKTVELARIREAVAAGVPASGRCARVVTDAREARRAPRAPGALDGDERRLRGGDRGGGDDGSRRDGDLRAAPGAPKGATRAMTIKGKKLGFVGAGNM